MAYMMNDRRPQISTVVMHHPSRGPEISALLAATADLMPRVVIDPDPQGPSSPLRTAKQAWAAVAEGATHHLVLQDDVEPCADFAEHLTQAVQARPEDVIALGVFSTAARNSYPVRRAAVAGEPWAVLVPGEFVPAQGLLMPAGRARALARFLAELPDELRDDDAFIDLFCRIEDLTVVATVPNLLEHVGDRSTANAGHGIRRMAAFVPAWPVDAQRWNTPPRVDKGAPMRAAPAADVEYCLSFVAGRCIVRVLLATADHPIWHPCLSWRTATAVTRVDTEAITAELIRAGARLAGSPPFEELDLSPQEVLEAWVAGFLLGADAGPPAGRPLTELAVEGWFSAAINAVTEVARDRAACALTRVAVEAVAAGQAYQRREPGLSPDLDPVVRALAEREASAMALTMGSPPPPVVLEVVDCPTCGATEGDAKRAAAEAPFGTVLVGGQVSAVALRILACEAVSLGMLAAISHLHERGIAPPKLRTRGVAYLEGGNLSAVEADERWFDLRQRVQSGTLPVTADPLPEVSGDWHTRLRANVEATVSVGPVPHVSVEGYAQLRDAAVLAVLRERNRACPPGPKVPPREQYALLRHPANRGERPMP